MKKNKKEEELEYNLEVLVEKIEDNMINYSINKHYKRTLKNLLKKHSLQELIDAVDISAENYIYDDTVEEYEEYLSKIKGIAYVNSMSDLDKEINYITNYILHIFNAKKWEVKNLIKEYAYSLRNHWGYDDEQIIKDLKEELKPQISKHNRYYYLEEFIDGWIKQIKG